MAAWLHVYSQRVLLPPAWYCDPLVCTASMRPQWVSMMPGHTCQQEGKAAGAYTLESKTHPTHWSITGCRPWPLGCINSPRLQRQVGRCTLKGQAQSRRPHVPLPPLSPHLLGDRACTLIMCIEPDVITTTTTPAATWAQARASCCTHNRLAWVEHACDKASSMGYSQLAAAVAWLVQHATA